MSRSEPIELGLTIPLQRHLRIKALPYSQEPDRRFCWDLHVITLRGRPSLLAVHCHSRYAGFSSLDSPPYRLRQDEICDIMN